MKKFKLLFIVLTMIFTGIKAQDYYLTAPIGYGAAATGGGTPSASNTVTVNSKSTLVAALTGTKSVILVSGTIDFAGAMSSVKVTNKTILGLPGAKLVNLNQTASGSGILYFKSGSTNVIIRNLIFEGPGAYDTDGNDLLCIDGGTNIWVDHCDFQDGCDGNFDMKNATDNISVTWCRFHYLKPPKAGGSGGTADHRFTDLIGSSSSDKPANRRITFADCWWDSGCVERMPRSRHSQFHFINCYWNSSSSKVNLGLGGCKAYIEACYFAQKKSIIYKDYSSDDGAAGNTLTFASCTGAVDGLPANLTAMGAFAKPTYSYTPLAVGSVVAAVSNATCGAGATLTVAADGSISTPCNNTTPTLNLTSGSNVQSIMASTAIGSIVYTYGGTATTCTTTGLPADITATVNTTNKTVTIAGTPATAGTYNYTVATNPSGVSLSGTITVAAAVPPTLSLTTGTASQTAYIGAPINSIVYTYGGGATNVTVANLPAGVTAVTDAINKTIIISGTPTTAGAKTVSLTTVGGSGAAVVLNNVITVNAPTTLGVPTGISVSPSATSASVSWTPVANASGYTLYVCDVPTGSGDKILFQETFNGSTVGNVVYDNASKYAAVKNSASCTEAGTIRLTNAIIKFTGLNLTGLENAKIYVKYKTTTLASAAIKVNDESGSSTNFIYKFTANASLFTFDDVVEQVVTVSGTDYIAIRADSGSDLIIDEIKVYIPGGGSSATCTEHSISGGSTSSFNLSGLTSGTTYNYQLKAISSNPAYLSGAYSTQASFIASGTLNPIAATLSLSSAASTEAQTIVQANAISAISYNYSGSTASITWTGTENSSTAPIGISSSINAGTISISGTPSLVGNYAYSINISGIDGGANASDAGTITVTADPNTANMTNSGGTLDQTVTSGNAITPIVLTWAGGSTGINVTGLPAGLTATTNAVAKTVTISGTPTASGTYTATTIAGTGSPVVLDGTITVNTPSSAATETFESVVSSSTSTLLSSGSDRTVTQTIGSYVWGFEKSRLSLTNAHGGVNCIRMLYGTGAVITPTLKGSQTVSFYAAGGSANAISIEVYLSTDNGSTWSASPIQTFSQTATTYNLYNVTINEASDNVKIKIWNKGGASGSTSYNLYIDDITYTPAATPTSTKDAKNNISLAQVGSELILTGVEASEIKLVSIQGAIVAQSKASQSVNVSNLPKGIYVALIYSNEGIATEKVIVK